MIPSIVLRFIATAAAKRLVIKILAILAKRTDNTIDDDIIAVIAELMEGDTKSVKKTALKKK